MQPFERLRSLARWRGGDDSSLVAEAADCLAGFVDDPAGLVVACRRLLVHHPYSGALWWLCARVLTAADPAGAAWDAWRLVDEDPTAERLCERLPFPHDDPIAVYGWPELCAGALLARPDLDVVVVRSSDGETRLRARLGNADRALRVLDEVEAVAASPSHVLFECAAAGGGRAVVSGGATRLLDELDASPWLVAGVGRVLPDRLAAALCDRVGDDHDVVELDRFEAVAGPHGLEPPDAVARRVDCPVAPELLRLD